jgi:hypothetical protein
MKIKMSDIRGYQAKRQELKTIGEFKTLGRELRDKFNLTDMEAIDILNNRSEGILKLLERQEAIPDESND